MVARCGVAAEVGLTTRCERYVYCVYLSVAVHISPQVLFVVGIASEVARIGGSQT